MQGLSSSTAIKVLRNNKLTVEEAELIKDVLKLVDNQRQELAILYRRCASRSEVVDRKQQHFLDLYAMVATDPKQLYCAELHAQTARVAFFCLPLPDPTMI